VHGGRCPGVQVFISGREIARYQPEPDQTRLSSQQQTPTKEMILTLNTHAHKSMHSDRDYT